jgi:hypothetical protein
MAVRVWNPSYVGSIGKRITVPGKLRQKAKPFPKSNQKKQKGWWHGSSGIVLAPSPNPNTHRKNKKVFPGKTRR